MMTNGRIVLFSAIALAGLLLVGGALPDWATFLLIIAFSKGLAALGLVVLLRSGLLSFGQGLFYCIGAYGAGLLMLWGGVNDAIVLVFAGGFAALIVGLITALLLAGYRKIFFATLTLALSMLVYGALTKADILGGSDGLNLHPAKFVGWQASATGSAVYAMYAIASVLGVGSACLMRIHFGSVRGLLSLGVKDNEIRVEYLGASARRVIFENFAVAAFLAGIGGALNALALGHIDPELAFWTTSGEFVFVAILAGQASVAAVFAASFLLELVRSFSSQYFPNVWQMMLGIFMLTVILFLPNGLGSLLQRRPRDKAVEGKAR
jgi:branched-chain amino acid transport system permease protein